VGSAYLSPDLASVFSKVRKHIKGSERRSRTEAFLEWAEENPDEIYAMQEQRAAREIERLVKEYQRETRRTAGDRESF
jgi:L-lactate utilization protein LutC